MKRLVVETEDAFERTLLKSARRDVAPRHAARNAVIALAAAAEHLASPSAAAAPDPSALGAAAAGAAKGGTLGVWKWLSIGAAVGGLAGAGVMASVQREPAVNPAAAPTVPTVPAVSGTPVIPAATAAQEPADPPAEAPAVSSSARARTRVAPASGPGAPNVAEPPVPAQEPVGDVHSTLAAEAAAIDRARRALASGSPGKAIELLDRYERESPTHVLAPDAQALRVQAEKARGNSALAKQLAEKFLSSHPNDPHADRVRRVLSNSPNP